MSSCDQFQVERSAGAGADARQDFSSGIDLLPAIFTSTTLSAGEAAASESFGAGPTGGAACGATARAGGAVNAGPT